MRDETAKDNRQTVACTKTRKTAKSSNLRCLRTHAIYKLLVLLEKELFIDHKPTPVT